MTSTRFRPLLLAHQTKISGEVGGTHHIEPNDTPRAGESATTWFALVRAGGKPIPLQDCDCDLVVYQSAANAKTAIATPSLRAIDVEGQTNVPAADIVFPEVGAYELVISGEPKGEVSFSPFELRFPITVAAGQAITLSPTSVTDSSTTDSTTTESAEALPSDSVRAEAIASPPSSNIPSENLLSRGLSPIGIGVGILAIGALLFLSRRPK